jgi:hypothetical protein
MSEYLQQGRRGDRGSALVYILIAIALLAALTVTFMEPSSQQTSSQNTFKTVSSVEGQIEMIRSAIQECVLSYAGGDRCIKDAGPLAGYCTNSAGTDPGARKGYPINPNSDFYTAATPGKSGDRLVRNMRCPGNNPGQNANHDNHALIFSGASGKYLGPAPDLFNDWQIYNGTDGVFFWISTDKSDAYLTAALQKLDEQYSECETDVIDATGGAEDLDSGGVPLQCASGSVCFRVWVIQNGSAEYNGDTDGDEAAANCT